MKNLIFVLLFCILSSCNKADSTPEISDEIYKDLLQELEVATKGLESEQKNLQKLQQEKEKAVPQTGQVKFAEKRVNETSNSVIKLQQQKQFFEIKIELRKAEVRQKYLESRKKMESLAQVRRRSQIIKLLLSFKEKSSSGKKTRV